LAVAYQACTSPNRQHGAPLATLSCNPPVQASDYLSPGTPDANGAAANFRGFVRLVVHPDDPATPADEADVLIKAATADIRCALGAPAAICGSTNVSATADYVGELGGRIGLRITDKDNTPSPGGAGPGTVSDAALAFTVPCTQTSGPFTPDTTIGSTCNLSTTVNSVYPGAIVAGKRAIWQLGQIEVFDGGSDGLASTTADNRLFLDQGVFVP
jgi:hypothetical protein